MTAPTTSATPKIALDQRASSRRERRPPVSHGPSLMNSGRLMDEAEHDVLAYMTFAAQHRTKLHSTNPGAAE